MKPFWTVVVLLSIIVIGTVLRIDNIEERTIGHIEMYVPGIEFPGDISIPRLRLTVQDTILRTLGEEPHPPGYYLLMFPWTKMFGTSLLSIRLPSVIFGVSCILLVYLLCVKVENKLTGLLAAGMLALNGLHIYWSQEAKFYIFACFLGLLSTLILVRLSNSERFQRIKQFSYIVITLAGLTTVIYFWVIFATHMLWSFINDWKHKRSVLTIPRLQILIFILGSPLWAIAAYQSRRESYILEPFLLEISQFFQFGFLFEPELYLESLQNNMPLICTVGLLALAAFLFIIGLIQKVVVAEPEVTANNESDKWLSSGMMRIIGIFCFLVILVFTKFSHLKDPSRTTLILCTGCVPLILPILDVILKKYWIRFCFTGRSLDYKIPLVHKLTSINTLLGIIPTLIIAVISFITPLFVARGMLLFVPYYIIILCRGIAALVQRHRGWVILLIILAVIHIMGVTHWQTRVHSPRNYKELYEKLTPKIKESDLIFVYRNWAMTPIFYYLKEDQYHLVGRNYLQALKENPNARIWVLCLPGMPMKEEIKDALKSYELQERVDAFNMWSLLYQKKP